MSTTIKVIGVLIGLLIAAKLFVVTLFRRPLGIIMVMFAVAACAVYAKQDVMQIAREYSERRDQRLARKEEREERFQQQQAEREERERKLTEERIARELRSKERRDIAEIRMMEQREHHERKMAERKAKEEYEFRKAEIERAMIERERREKVENSKEVKKEDRVSEMIPPNPTVHVALVQPIVQTSTNSPSTTVVPVSAHSMQADYPTQQSQRSDVSRYWCLTFLRLLPGHPTMQQIENCEK